jgi:hypothetical protein
MREAGEAPGTLDRFSLLARLRKTERLSAARAEQRT